MTGRSRLTGAARLAGVIGWPVKHSRSPRLHGHWLERYGIDGAYLPLAVDPKRLETAVRGLQASGFRGANLTLPHKELVLPLIDRMSERARRIGAVNTIVFSDGGSIEGDNTDGFGFMESLKADARAWTAADGVAIILGAGGAARAVAAALLDAGAPGLRIVNRTVERAERLAEALRTIAPGRSIEPIAWDKRADVLADAHLLVNTTSLGMNGQPPLDLALDRLPQTALVTDIVYTPLETGLLAAAHSRGNDVVDGLGMLLHQGRPGFARWFGVDPEVTDDLRRDVLDGGG